MQTFHRITTENPCTWTAIMRNLNVIAVQEGFAKKEGVNRWAYAFTLGRLTQKQLEWVMRFPNVEVTERNAENLVRPDGVKVKRIFTVYLFPTYTKEN